MATQANTAGHLESKMKEAEAYHSMGLVKESLSVYQEILSGIPGLTKADQRAVSEKIAVLEDQIASHENEAYEEVSSEDLTLFKEKLSSDQDETAMLDSAASLMELGLFKEATETYERLLRMVSSGDEIIPYLVESIFKAYSPSEANVHIKEIVKEINFRPQDEVRLKYLAGLEMEKRDSKALALEFFEAAREIDPRDNEIKAKADALSASMSYKSRYDYLLKEGRVTTKQLQQALALSKKTGKSVEHLLIENYNIKKEEVGRSLSCFYGCRFRSYDPEIPLPTELVSNLKKSFLLNELWVPLSWDKDGIEVLINDPADLIKADHIGTVLKTSKFYFSVGIKEDIEGYIKLFFDERKSRKGVTSMELADDLDLIPDISFEEEEELDEEDESGVLDESSGKVVRLVDQTVITAYRRGASDIHVEPSPSSKTTTIRFRVDGVCQDYIKVPNSMARAILARIKVMASLDIAEKRRPQDGKIKFKRKGVPEFEIRVATLPTTGNFEDAVLRILAKAGAMKLEDMELGERNLNTLKEILDNPYGLILAVGPTGSGKTTTLHSALNYVKNPGIKIWTAEDPVEITQPGLRQVEAKPQIGLTFANIMRSFLRADPDVIMIGEMRDHETASIGIEASLTGHLVFSTLHTNNAPETVTRLLDMGLNPLNFSDAFLGVIAQRLVRRLCTKCREPYHPSKAEFDDIVKEYGQDYFDATGISFSRDLTLYRPLGCEACSGSGYKGRLGIFEIMKGSGAIKSLIKTQGTSEDLFKQAMQEGMTTLKQDGILKVFRGLTDFKEIRRVCIA